MSAITSRPTRPLLRYHGGKWRLAPKIIEQFPSHRIYVEPYGGGASVLLRKPRSYAEVYNDLDGEVVNVFRVVRDHGAELQQALELTPFAREEFTLSYEPSSDPVEQARRTLIRAHMGFGTAAWRTNLDGTPRHTSFRSNAQKSGTIPAHDWRNLAAIVPAFVERLRGVVIEHREASEVMATNDGPDTLHYVDPTYVHATRSKREESNLAVYRHEMTDDDHRHLAAFLTTLQGSVIVSGYPSALYDDLFSEWRRLEFKAYADGAKERTEVLWLRNVPDDLYSQNQPQKTVLPPAA